MDFSFLVYVIALLSYLGVKVYGSGGVSVLSEDS
jgi:hypothetical protein